MARRILSAPELAAERGPAFPGGMEFYPLIEASDLSPVVLHQAGSFPNHPASRKVGGSNFAWRLYFDERGGIPAGSNNEGADAPGARIVVIPSRHPSHLSGGEEAPGFWLAFSCGQQLSPRHPVPIGIRAAPIEIEVVGQLSRLLQDQNPERNRQRILHGSLALVSLVLGRPEFVWNEEEPPQISRIRRHINENLDGPLYTEEMARLVHMSESSFTRLFRTRHDLSPAQFVTRVRVREAARRLLDTSESVDQIAEETGFPNRAYFSRVFRRVTGEPPACFRRRRAPDAIPRAGSEAGAGQ